MRLSLPIKWIVFGMAGPGWLAAALAAAPAARAQTWTEITPGAGPQPPARTLASAVYDAQDRRMVVFGGQGVSGLLNDVWEFDLDTHSWTDVTPPAGAAPSVRFTPVSAYDPTGHRMITWSGQTSGTVFLNDAWSFDLTSGVWSQLAPAGGPPNIRYGAAGVFDPLSGDLVTFAGFTDQGRFDDVWRLDGAAPAWTDVSPATGPLRRCLLSASYDAGEHRLIMYGGQNAGALGDIWAFDLTLETWTDLTPVDSPPGRFFTAQVYDASTHRATIFGGNTGSAKSNEVWVFDLTAEVWRQLNPAGTPPSAREGAVAVYDGPLDRIVIFGGRDSAIRNDVWELAGLSTAVTGVPGGGPAVRRLHRSHPNPFRGSTVIEFELPQATPVSLAVYDVRGRRIRSLVRGAALSGPQAVAWDGRDDRGAAAAPGVYFYRLDTAAGSGAGRMVHLAR